MASGIRRDEASHRATPFARAALLNDARLAPAQWDKGHCLICEGPDTPDSALVPVLSAAPGEHHWLHDGACHAEHRRRQEEKADAILIAAGVPQSDAA